MTRDLAFALPVWSGDLDDELEPEEEEEKAVEGHEIGDDLLLINSE